ncbi:MAG TPA: PaaX family transcriptional regulator C-terminal domain-containing protein [Solirubrobacteraceae bacterium]|jgi:phenylacetic acid degradation operon negative regulatory protein|nr:PaaX family transcriptional regulator C-terminal domain-containing protein [Solirubrobacteraceae bacterium]
MPPEGGNPFKTRGADSAQALLLVVIGEFAYPRDRPVWNSTFVQALSLLDLEPPAIGAAIRRAAASGLLTPIRSGRRVAWQLTAPAEELLSAGGERVFSFRVVTDDWDGRWLMIWVSVPERRKGLRHQLRRRLEWLGFGSPTPGLWLSPHAGRAPDARRVLDDLGLSGQAISSIGPFGPVGDERAMVRSAWDLESLAAAYSDFSDTFGALRPRTDAEAFRAHVGMTQSWRRFPYVDPLLPRQFLPARWPGEAAARLVKHYRERWGERSRRVWELLRDGA